MTKLEQAIAANQTRELLRTIETIIPTPSPCSDCIHVGDFNRCTIPDPSMPIPAAIRLIGCGQWEWSGIPF